MFSCSSLEVNPLARFLPIHPPPTQSSNLPAAVSWCKRRAGYPSIHEKANQLVASTYFDSWYPLFGSLLRQLRLANGPRGYTTEFRAERHEQFNESISERLS
jgi:hypothetical protein